jgi:phenylalanyl-tRNA synthetase beta chain
MKLVYQDLLNFLNEKPSKKVLSDKLFQLGHEHEIHGDIFDMELTPNRGDCLSLIGLARDLNVFFGISDTVEIYKDNIESLDIDFENLATDECAKISFLEIEIEKASSGYKPYLENYFSVIGNNKTNFFTDISNYISYELGQPTHCFNRDSINSKFLLENKEINGRFKTLLGTEISLAGKNCVFSMNEEVISLAGIMGGASTACNPNTKSALIECAYFNPELIIGKSTKYNLTSDAAHKFERGVDIAAQDKVLRRFVKIVQDHAVIKSIKFKSFVSKEPEEISIPIDVKKINDILGTQLNEAQYLSYIEKLGFEINTAIKVPSYRSDIKTQNDLAEEIARVIGYNNIDSIPLNLKTIINNSEIDKVSLIESFLVRNGFSEVINFPFTSIKEKSSIVIDNPLDSNRENFRTRIKESLISNLLYNERRQKDSIKLFEISDIYIKDSDVKKKKILGIIISGRSGNDFINFSKKLDQKYLDQLLNKNLNNEYFKVIEILRNDLDTKKKDKIFYVEIALSNIPELFFSSLEEAGKKSVNFVRYVPISEFPSSTRDFSFSISNLSKVDEVIKILKNTSDLIIKNSFIFDFYKNEKTETVKLGYRFIFQSDSKTLSDEEINKKVNKIIAPIIELDGVSIPGM